MRTLIVVFAILWAVPALAQSTAEAEDVFWEGIDMLDREEWLGAIAAFEAALATDPDLCNAHFYLAEAQLALETPDGWKKAARAAEAYLGCAEEDTALDIDGLERRIVALEEVYGEEEVEKPVSRRRPVAVGGLDTRRSPLDRDDWTVESGRNRVRDWSHRRKIGLGMLIGGGLAGGFGLVGNIVLHNLAYNNWRNEQFRHKYEWAQPRVDALGVIGAVGLGVAGVGLLLVIIPDGDQDRFSLVPGPVTTVTIRF